MIQQGEERNKSAIRENVHTVEQDRAAQITGERQGRPSLYTCPECSGTLWQVDEPEIVQFRCHVGHVLSGELLLDEQAETAENALWYSIRTLTDRAVLGRQLREYARKRGDEEAAKEFDRLAANSERKAEQLRQIIEEPLDPSPP